MVEGKRVGDYCPCSRGGSEEGSFTHKALGWGGGDNEEGRRPYLQFSGWIRLIGTQHLFLLPFCIPLCYRDEKLKPAFPRLSYNQGSG